MSTLIFGGAGFIGKPLAEQLFRDGERVICTDIKSDAELKERTTFVNVDISDAAAVDELVAEYNPDRIINLAYMLGAESENQPQDAVRVNCVGMDNAFAAAIGHDVERVVYTSSIAVYGRPEAHEGTITEDVAPPAAFSQYPALFYGATKQLNEYQARMYDDRSETDFVAVRPSIVFGPGREGGITKWVSDCITRPAHGEDTHIPYPPEQPLSLVYRDDVAELLSDIVTATEPAHQVYNTGGHHVTVGQLVDAIEEQFQQTITTDQDADSVPLVADVDHTRAADEFDYNLRSIGEAIDSHRREVT